MNKILLLFATIALLMFMAGCDKIDDPKKPYFPIGEGKTVLVKDFTGVRCVNCPAAAEAAHELQHNMGEDYVIILSVHAGPLAQPAGAFPDFLTEEGTSWYGDNDSNPLFSVDHVGLTEGNILYVEQIDTPVSDALAEQQTFDVYISNSFDETNRQLDVQSNVMTMMDVTGDFYVTVCLVEDSIVGWQRVPEGVDREYVFRNVFRGTMNGTDGELFGKGMFDIDTEKVFNCTMVLDSTYNADQCYSLTYVYDKTDGKIMQTAIRKIK